MLVFLILTALLSSSHSLQCPSIPPGHERVPCLTWWNWDLTEQQCTERGCCWDPAQPLLQRCFYTATTAAPVEDVYVIQGCHLDIGFVKSATDIVNLWFHHHFPLAHSVGKALAASGGEFDAQLKFTAQSWLVSMYVSCPPDWEGIVCPNATQLAQFEESVRNGWITWHAFPFNGEPELADEDLLDYAIELTHSLDDRFGVPRKQVMSQRDVPGMTRAILPLLARHNITTISVGVNGGSTPPNVPKAFLWRDSPSNTTLQALYVQGGYGGINFFNKEGLYVHTRIPGSTIAAVVDWRGDNAGPPPSPDDVRHHFAQLRRQFPSARIRASTFDDFARTLRNHHAALPTLTAEIGDTWIYGVSSDPVKQAQLRRIGSLRQACVRGGACVPSDARVEHFSRLFLKGNEHTWGVDDKTFVRPPALHANWSNVEFEVERTRNPGYAALEASWVRQRRWAVADAVDALGDHPLAGDIERVLADMRSVHVPSTANYTRVHSVEGTRFRCGQLEVGFSSASGALVHVKDLTTGLVWADGGTSSLFGGNSTLGAPLYRTYSGDDYVDFTLRYSYLGPLGRVDDGDDFEKIGIDKYGATRRSLGTQLRTLWTRETAHNTSEFLVEQQFVDGESVHRDVGAPASLWLRVSVGHSAARSVNMTLLLFNKTATRLPETTMLHFRPSLPNTVVHVNKLNSAWIDPLDVMTGGSAHLHATGPLGVRFTHPGTSDHDPSSSLTISSPDIALVSLGAPSPFPTPTSQLPDIPRFGVSFVVHNNLWNTNYPTWFPFGDPLSPEYDTNLKFDFTLSFT